MLRPCGGNYKELYGALRDTYSASPVCLLMAGLGKIAQNVMSVLLVLMNNATHALVCSYSTGSKISTLLGYFVSPSGAP